MYWSKLPWSRSHLSLEFQFILHHTGYENLPNDLHWKVVLINTCSNSPKYYCKKCTKTYKEKIYVGHEALRVTKQFEEKRSKVALKPEQVRIPDRTVRVSEQSSTDMRSTKLQPGFSGSGFLFRLSFYQKDLRGTDKRFQLHSTSTNKLSHFWIILISQRQLALT